MTHPFIPKSQSSDSDIAYHLLLAQGHSMNYQDLIQEVLKSRNLPFEPGKVSEVLTEINLDTRFTYLGKGEWGLRAWVTSKGSRKSVGSLSKNAVEDDDEADLDEEKDLLLEEDFEGEPNEEEGDAHELPEVSYKNKRASKRSKEDSWN